MFLGQRQYLSFFLLRFVEHLHLRESALIVVGGVAVHQYGGFVHILAGFRLLSQFGVYLSQEHVAATVGNGGRRVWMDAAQGIVERLLPVVFRHRHLAGGHVYLCRVVEHHFGTADVGQRFFHACSGRRHILMACHHEDAGFAGQRVGKVMRLLFAMGTVVGQCVVGSLQGLVVLRCVEVYARESLLGQRHHQRVARGPGLLDGLQVVALGLAVVAHLCVQLTYIIVEDGLALPPVVLLEDGQRQLVVVDGQVGLVLHVVDIAQTAVNDGAGIVDCFLVIAFLRGHRVDDGQRLVVEGDGLVIFLTAIVHLCEVADYILPHVKPVLPIAQCQRFATVVFSFFTVVRQPAAHQFVVGTQEVVTFRWMVALQCRFQRINTGVAVVVVSLSRQAGKQA